MLYVIGIGPGSQSMMTLEAIEAIRDADIIVGYKTYTHLVKALTTDKEVLKPGKSKEIERCQEALNLAVEGKKVALISSGDAGIYGMAGLILELVTKQKLDVEVKLIAGVTASTAEASLLGAPLMHDFAVISLSDLMTPWTLIEKRLAAAASADMAICLYNPSSKKRRDYLNKACRIVMQAALPETVCGIVKQIGRECESCQVMTLQELSNYEADMFTTVFIGNSTTKVINGKMVTARGYKLSE